MVQHELLVPDCTLLASEGILKELDGDDILIAHVLLSRIIIARQVWCMGCQGVRGAGVGGRGVVRFVVRVGRAAKFEADIIEAYRFNTR